MTRRRGVLVGLVLPALAVTAGLLAWQRFAGEAPARPATAAREQAALASSRLVAGELASLEAECEARQAVDDLQRGRSLQASGAISLSRLNELRARQQTAAALWRKAEEATRAARSSLRHERAV